MSNKITSDSDEEKKPVLIKNATDLQRLKLEKLMKNPDKPVVIPDPPKSKNLPPPPDFVRNVMGSSAGAGSGEFHVYRHLRRKEYARQRFIQEKSEKEKLDEEYHKKIEDNRRAAEERTAKKRVKRLKKKRNAKIKEKRNKTENKEAASSQSDVSSDNDNESNGNIQDCDGTDKQKNEDIGSSKFEHNSRNKSENIEQKSSEDI
ncbi:PRKR-interacting protein 1 homolog [Bombyx mandarina]|uniref:PRKR-interacting protein 1 homolog n=1 Tax=Bombyx mandarina TaxID=7092 RepID=A0A6J2JVG5_BOMMA|nr:PRKR-interacting protein 1 homolog [Bombyx mandarina]